MKNNLIVFAALAVISFALTSFCIASEKETVKVEKSKVVVGISNALHEAKSYMEHGSSWISIHHKFMDSDTNRWQVEATFYQ